MEVTYLGLSSVRLRGRDTSVVIDPIQAGLPGTGRGGADLVVRTEGSTEPADLRPHDGGPQQVAGPGEYELRGVSVRGIAAGETTIMRVEVDDVRVAHLGRLTRQLTEEEIDFLGHIDVLVLPVGGVDALYATDAVRVVRAVEPAVVVPVRYRGAGAAEYEPLDQFIKEMGVVEGGAQAQAKLNLTGASGATDETRVVVLEARG